MLRLLQWSPVLETGNTPYQPREDHHDHHAAMEPGFRDREYIQALLDRLVEAPHAAMEPGFRDREYGSTQNPLLATSLAGLRERCQPSPGQGAAGAPAGGGKHGSD